MPGEREIQVISGRVSHRQWFDSSGREMMIIVPPTVYPPREDSTLLDQALNTIMGEGKMLEIGCGTGVVSVSSAKRGWIVDACDINPLAIAASRGLAEQEGVAETTRFLETGLPESVLTSSVNDWAPSPPYDVICWNLPYLDPAKHGEQRLGPLEEASMSDFDAAGGWSKILRNQLENSPDLLARNGVVVLVHKAEGRGGRALTEWLASGWSIRPLAHISFGGERLVAVALWRGWSDIEPRLIDETTSTMDEMQQEDPPGTVVRAILQTGGRGQRDKLWHSTNNDLTATWRIHNGVGGISPVGIMQLGSGLAVVDAISASVGRIAPMLAWTNASEERRLGLRLKWPNDILFSGVGRNTDSTVKSKITNLNGTKSGSNVSDEGSNKLEQGTKYNQSRNSCGTTIVGKLSGILMQGRTIGQTTTIDVGIGINHITRWLDDECYAGLFELGLNISPPTLLPILSAALGGRFQQHDRLPPASTSELQKQWWALAAHQQMSHLDGTIQHGGLDDFSQTFEQDDSKQQALAGFSNTERFDQQKKVENVNPANNRENDRGKQHNRTAGHPTITNSETVEAKQHRQGSQLGEREDTGEKDFDCEIQEPRVGTNESSATRIIGTDKNGGLIILNSINKIVLYESF